MLCGDWITLDDLCLTTEELEDINEVQAALAISRATSWLHDSTCQQWPGGCTSTLRLSSPCGCPTQCQHSTRWRRRDLSTYVVGPITAITEVAVDGTAIPDTDYRLANGRWLVPQSGGALQPVWPGQDMSLPDGDVGTWSVTVEHGVAPPPHVLMAAAFLAKQLYYRCSGGDCQLPDNATSMNADGVTFEFKVPVRGETGLPTVDSIIGMYTCQRVRRMLDPAMPDAEVVRALGGG